jgi:hypothetical protein
LVEWDANEGWIKLKNPTKSFSLGEAIIGDNSGAIITLNSYNDIDSTDTKYYENEFYEVSADDIIDFTESNPFGVAT